MLILHTYDILSIIIYLKHYMPIILICLNTHFFFKYTLMHIEYICKNIIIYHIFYFNCNCNNSNQQHIILLLKKKKIPTNRLHAPLIVNNEDLFYKML